MLENDALQGQMLQTEKDTIDVITFLKKEDAVKDQHVSTHPYKAVQTKKGSNFIKLVRIGLSINMLSKLIVCFQAIQFMV